MCVCYCIIIRNLGVLRIKDILFCLVRAILCVQFMIVLILFWFSNNFINFSVCTRLNRKDISSRVLKIYTKMWMLMLYVMVFWYAFCWKFILRDDMKNTKNIFPLNIYKNQTTIDRGISGKLLEQCELFSSNTSVNFICKYLLFYKQNVRT